MRRQFAALIAVLGLVVSACTSSAAADPNPATGSALSHTSTEEAQATRLVRNFFASLHVKEFLVAVRLMARPAPCDAEFIDSGFPFPRHT